MSSFFHCLQWQGLSFHGCNIFLSLILFLKFASHWQFHKQTPEFIHENVFCALEAVALSLLIRNIHSFLLLTIICMTSAYEKLIQICNEEFMMIMYRAFQQRYKVLGRKRNRKYTVARFNTLFGRPTELGSEREKHLGT